MSSHPHTFESLDEFPLTPLPLLSPPELLEATANMYTSNPHIRTQSISKFVENGTYATRLAMRRDLDRLIEKMKPEESKIASRPFFVCHYCSCDF